MAVWMSSAASAIISAIRVLAGSVDAMVSSDTHTVGIRAPVPKAAASSGLEPYKPAVFGAF